VRALQEIGGQEAPVLAVPVHPRTAGAGRGLERAEMAHRQRRLVGGVAERQRFALGFLEQFVAHGITEFVLDLRGREVGDGVAKRAALECEHLKARVGQLLAENARRPAEADEHDVYRGKSRCHQVSFNRVPSRPSRPTVGIA
jgi:hypothetical protein